eukprot:TRINITY_DN2246_c0_g2_i1.p1 TRINITY_DN2246_c0_g2~~TRINITY_DN2246_c0_g2_i1.p1  ORF type:complete len:209 (-),score=-13.99 TRINITY_DN2246_c0_g2_i1:70-696(-)
MQNQQNIIKLQIYLLYGYVNHPIFYRGKFLSQQQQFSRIEICSMFYFAQKQIMLLLMFRNTKKLPEIFTFKDTNFTEQILSPKKLAPTKIIQFTIAIKASENVQPYQQQYAIIVSFYAKFSNMVIKAYWYVYFLAIGIWKCLAFSAICKSHLIQFGNAWTINFFYIIRKLILTSTCYYQFESPTKLSTCSYSILLCILYYIDVRLALN